MKLLKILILIIMLHVATYADDINIDNIVSKAVKTNKHVMIFFHMTYCGACKKMKNISIKDNNIQTAIEKDFIYIHVNIDDLDEYIYKNFEGDNHEFAREMGVSFYPTTIFIDKDSKVAYQLNGYRDANKLLEVIEYVSTKSYLKMRLCDFIDEKEFNKE